MIERFQDLVNKLKSTMGRLEKERFLNEYQEDNEVRETLYFLFNPYIVTGISNKKLNKKQKQISLLDVGAALLPANTVAPTALLELLNYFKTHNTGRDADVKVLRDFAKQFNDEQKELIYSLVKKDLKLGIQEKTLNRVFGSGFIPTMDVMLAESWAENEKYLVEKEFLVTEKFDGVRAVLIFSGETPTFYSRGGRVIEDLVELSEEAKKLNPEYVYDGELLLANFKTNNSADHYRATVRITSSDNEKRGLNFNIFDRLLKTDFMLGLSKQYAIDRKTELAAELRAIDSKFLREVPIIYQGRDLAQIPILLERHTQNGEEGLMINPSHSPYECKRTKNLLKVKKFNTADVLAESMEEGTGANKGRLGAVWVRFIGPDGKEYTCKVGSGFKQDEREHFFANPNDILGKIIEINYFEASKNKNDDNYSLRFPTFKHIRHDKTEISMH